MGSGKRPKNIEYVPPEVGGESTKNCPTFAHEVRAFALAPIKARSHHRVRISHDTHVWIGDQDAVASVVDPAESLLAALSEGCKYLARFDEPVATGEMSKISLILE
jgi:hypothetical protein